jgi:enterochelin esterase family protein
VFIPNVDRNRDLGVYPPFATFVAGELIPWVRERYRIRPGPEHVIAAGSSRGGFEAAYCAFLHSDIIGNVLSQSGAFRITPGDPFPGYPYADQTGWLVEAFRRSPRLPIRFCMEIGRFDDSVFMVPSNRELRDVLIAKGYDVTYREFSGGHDWAWWRGSFADALLSLLGHD